MAYNFNNLNKRSTVREGIDTQSMEFKPLKEFCGQRVKCDGFFFTDGKYGKQVVVVGSGYLINMPARAVEQFDEIAGNAEAVDEVLKGHLVLKDIKMIDTRNGKTTAYTLSNA